jgi:protein involved in polysaccharide export with SLBB domain
MMNTDFSGGFRRAALAAALLALGLAPLPGGRGALGQTSDAALRVGDTFELRLSGVPASQVAQVGGSFTIDAEGTVNLAYIGKIRAVDMTPSQLQSTIEKAYRDAEIFTRPTITVFMQAAGRFVNISGEVKSPRRINYTPDLTLLKALTDAGDFTEFADRKKVRVLRGNEVIVVDVKRIQQDPSQDIKLLPGDQIIIRQSSGLPFVP